MKLKIKNVKCKITKPFAEIFNFKFYILHLNRGFTLMELMVSIGIFALITTAVVANFRQSERSDELRLAAEQFASAIREISTMAQTGSAPSGGYGIHIDTAPRSPVQFFSDTGNGGGGPADKMYNEGEALPQPIGTLPPSVQITSVFPDNTTLDIVFEPPTPIIWINGGQNAAEARIILHHDKTGQDRGVVIKRLSGRIEVE